MKFKVQVKTIIENTVEVEAKDYDEACRKAVRDNRIKYSLDGLVQPQLLFDANVLEQIDGPYFEPCGWHKKAQQKDPWDEVAVANQYGDFVKIAIKPGGVWSDGLINIMRNRLKQIGLTVVRYSLGYDGRNTLTFKVTGRKDKEPMSAEDQAVLLANP